MKISLSKLKENLRGDTVQPVIENELQKRKRLYKVHKARKSNNRTQSSHFPVQGLGPLPQHKASSLVPQVEANGLRAKSKVLKGRS